MNSQVGHAYVVGIRVDKGDGDSTAPIFGDGAFFSGKPPPGFFNLILTHKFLLTPHPLSLSPYEGEREDNLLKGLRPF